MKTSKIFMYLLSALIMVLTFVAFTNGAPIVGIITAGTGLSVPIIKSASLSDADTLAAELNSVFGEMAKSLQKAISDEYKEKGALSTTELDAKLKELGLSEKALSDINSTLTAHGLRFEQGEASNSKATGLSGMLKSAFSAPGLLDAIKGVYENRGNGSIEVTKAVGNVTTGNVTTDTGGSALLDMLNADIIADIRLNMPFIEDFATVSSTNKPVYTYVDYLPGEGDVQFLGEGGTKTQLDLDITVKTQTPSKAAGYEILTEEAITDIPRMESNAKGLLLRKYLLKRQNGILFGDGIGTNPTGVTKFAALFDPDTWLGTKVDTPNLHDCIIAVANQIYTTTSYTDDVEYYPNVAFVNPADFAALRLAKDGTRQYIFPSITLFNDKTIDGIRMIPKNKIPQGYILMGDFQKLNIIDYVAYSVRIGWINDQFIKNLFTMLGEGRFYTFVKALDQRAFVYDTIANVTAGITAEV